MINKFFRAASALIAVTAFITSAASAQEIGNQNQYPERDAARSAADSDAPRAIITVEPGQSIQDAVDRAEPGDRVQIMPGVYHESVVVDFDDIELVGVVVNGQRPILDGQGEMNDAIMVSGHNFLIQGIEMRNYKANGVVVNQAENVTFRDVVGVNTGKYAIYPVQCDGVLIENCIASDVWDAGIYAGQCKNVEIRNCVAFRNTIGIEAENSENVLIHSNTTFNNALGILVVLLPNLPSKIAENTLVTNNNVFDNNYPNKAPEGQIVSGVVPGTGILIAAADSTEVTRNDIRGNGSFGILLAALTDSMEDGQQIGDRTITIDVEPNPDNNYIHGNTFENNGYGELPARYVAFGLERGADLMWTGKGTGNVWDEATATRFPPNLPGPTAGETTGGGR